VETNTKKWFVYIVLCQDGSFYTGITPNLERRIQEHKEGRGGRYTLLHKAVRVVFTECFNNKKEALVREQQLKG
jgi:predicted GIY-YIG superfamily endonuclease